MDRVASNSTRPELEGVTMMRRVSLGSVSLSAAMALSACGGSKAPSIDQVQQDFNSPSGSVQDKEGVMQVSARQGASGSELALVGNVAGSIGGGTGLSARPLRGFEQISPQALFGPYIAYTQRYLAGEQVQALATTQPCVDPTTIQSSLASGGFSASGGSASFNVTADFSKCTSNVTGTANISGKIQVSAGSFTYTINETLNNVCQSDGTKSCVTGEVDFKMSANTSGAGMTASSAFTMLTGYYLDISYTDAGGNAIKTNVKGGLRLAANSSSATTGGFSYDYLFYAKSAAKAEVSYVLSLDAQSTDGTTSGSFTIKGTDGSIDCSVQSSGAGMCTATGSTMASIMWSDADAATVSGKLSSDYRL
jgi:hypothetical protein